MLEKWLSVKIRLKKRFPEVPLETTDKKKVPTRIFSLGTIHQTVFSRET
jgi:hypothetical protein